MQKDYLFNEIYCLCLCKKKLSHLLDINELSSISDFARDRLICFFEKRCLISTELLESSGPDADYFLEENLLRLLEFQALLYEDPLFSTVDKQMIAHLLWMDHDRLCRAFKSA